MRVAFTQEAQRDFLAAVGYIATRDPAAAARFRRRVWGLLRRLAKFPRLGREVPELPGRGYREVIHNPYRLFYRIDDNRVVVVAVWHGAQEPTEPRR